jgi:hypothetical protein
MLLCYPTISSRRYRARRFYYYRNGFTSLLISALPLTRPFMGPEDYSVD